MWYLLCFIVGLAVGGVGVWYYGIKRPQLKNKVVAKAATVVADIKKV